jgi:hypothetical protein
LMSLRMVLSFLVRDFSIDLSRLTFWVCSTEVWPLYKQRQTI